MLMGKYFINMKKSQYKQDKSIFNLTYLELDLFVNSFKLKREVVTDMHERFLIYESYKRAMENEEPLTMKWIEQTLRLSFPKVQSMVSRLVESGYFKRVQSTTDKRIFFFEPTVKLIRGVDLYEQMKLNELHSMGITEFFSEGKPSLSDFNAESQEKFKSEFID